jgi:hypothetical protein
MSYNGLGFPFGTLGPFSSVAGLEKFIDYFNFHFITNCRKKRNSEYLLFFGWSDTGKENFFDGAICKFDI